MRKEKYWGKVLFVQAIIIVGVLLIISSTSKRHKEISRAIWCMQNGYETILDGEELTGQDKISLVYEDVKELEIHVDEKNKIVYLFRE